MIISFLEKTKTFSEIYRTQTNLKNHEKYIYLKFYHQQEFTGYPVGLRHYLWLLPGKIIWKKCCNFQGYKSLRLESRCAVTRVKQVITLSPNFYFLTFIIENNVYLIELLWELKQSIIYFIDLMNTYGALSALWQILEFRIIWLIKKEKTTPSSDLNSGGKDGH